MKIGDCVKLVRRHGTWKVTEIVPPMFKAKRTTQKGTPGTFAIADVLKTVAPLQTDFRK